MKKLSILAILCLSTLVASPAPSLLSVTGLAVLPHYSLVTVGTVPELKALSMTILSTSTMGLVMGYYAPGTAEAAASSGTLPALRQTTGAVASTRLATRAPAGGLEYWA